MSRLQLSVFWSLAVGLNLLTWPAAVHAAGTDPRLAGSVDDQLVTLEGSSDRADALRPAGRSVFAAAVAGDTAAVELCGCDSCCGSGCGSRCGSSCGSCRGGCRTCCSQRRLFGIIAPSDHCYSDFVSPISNPLFFEDPRTLTEVRPMFVEHSFPRSQAVLQGGDAQVYAMQIRAALTKRLSIVANKDGYIDLNTPGIGSRSGWAATAAGVKYNLIRRPSQQFVLSTGLIYEMASGEADVFQGLGDGEFHLFLSSGARPFDNLFWISGTGFRLPCNTQLGSQMYYLSNSFAYRFIEGSRPSTGWYAMWETNWFYWYNSGNNLPFNFEGADLINFGSTNVNGNNIVTMLAGLKWKPAMRVELGAGWEFKVNAQDNALYGNRAYAQAIFRY